MNQPPSHPHRSDVAGQLAHHMLEIGTSLKTVIERNPGVPMGALAILDDHPDIHPPQLLVTYLPRTDLRNVAAAYGAHDDALTLTHAPAPFQPVLAITVTTGGVSLHLLEFGD